MVQKNLVILLYICCFLILCFPVSSAGIPFSGNHTYDELQELISGISDRPAYLTDYLQGINKTPSDTQSSFYLGKAALKASNVSEAERQFSYVISKAPSEDSAWKGLFVSLVLQEKYDDLYNATLKRIAYDPYTDWVWIERGMAEAQKDQIHDSLESFHKALTLNPKNIFAHYYSAWSYQNLKQSQNAIKSYQKVKVLSPEYGGVDGNIAFLYLGMNEYDAALPYLEKALIWYPDWAEAHRSKGMVLYHLGQKEEALKVFDDAIRLNPEYINNYLSKADALKDMGQYPQALIPVETGLSFEMNDTNLLVMKGDILMKTNRFDEANATFANISANCGDNTSPCYFGFNSLYALWAQGYCMEQLGKPEEAKSAYQQAQKRMESFFTPESPESGFLWHLKSKILTGLGEYQKAEVAEKKALELGYTENYYL